MDELFIEICGNVQTCRTEAEILRVRSNGSPDLIAMVFESDDQWHVETVDESLDGTEKEQMTSIVKRAQESLGQYVNRQGNNRPNGLNVAGLSLWLMEKSDGTAMGRPYPDNK